MIDTSKSTRPEAGEPTFVTPDSTPSLAELIDLAHGLERRAAVTYTQLAAELRLHGNEEAAEVFDWLAEEESSHIGAVEQLAREFHSAPCYADIRPSDGDSETPRIDDSGPYLLTPYEAFDRAVENERRAFSFFSRIASHAEDDAVRTFAERLAKEELGHLTLCRLERRRAFRVQIEESGAFEEEVALESLEDLKARRDATRATLARLYRAISHMARHSGEDRVALVLENLARDLAPGNYDRSPHGERRETEIRSCFAAVRNALRATERAYTWYLAASDRAESEELLFAAQDVAAEFIEPMRTIREQLDRLSP